MLNRLRQSLFTSAMPLWQAGELAPGQRIYAIGDIHGRADLLTRLLRKIETDAGGFAGEVTLVAMGDVIDHGPQSAEVVDILQTQLPASWQAVFLRGNHEWMMQRFIESPEEWMQWLGWGGEATLASYGVRARQGNYRLRPPGAIAAELAHALEAYGHQGFYHGQRNYWRHQGYAFVHAGVREGLDWDDQLESDLLMQHRADFTGRHDLPERIVFGHTIQPRPLVSELFIGIDTGARDSGVLTAAVLEEKQLRFLQTRP
jgi:serine/threonine protein phosphatase 1